MLINWDSIGNLRLYDFFIKKTHFKSLPSPLSRERCPLIWRRNSREILFQQKNTQTILRHVNLKEKKKTTFIFPGNMSPKHFIRAPHRSDERRGVIHSCRVDRRSVTNEACPPRLHSDTFYAASRKRIIPTRYLTKRKKKPTCPLV